MHGYKDVIFLGIGTSLRAEMDAAKLLPQDVLDLLSEQTVFGLDTVTRELLCFDSEDEAVLWAEESVQTRRLTRYLTLVDAWAKEKGWTLENAVLTGMEAEDEWAAKWREKR